jgi:hypothetical protein
VDYVVRGFHAVERGLAREVDQLATFLNGHYAPKDPFNQVQFDEVRRLAATCVTGCAIPAATTGEAVGAYDGWSPRLVALADAGRDVT